MLDAILPAEQKNLKVTPEPIELVFTEGGLSTFSVVLSPFEDLAEMIALEGKSISIKEFAKFNSEKMEQNFSNEFAKLKNKIDFFDHSPTYLNRLANLASASGRFDDEGKYLEQAANLSASENFFIHRKGANLIARERFVDAEALFSSLDLGSDIHANLRLAYFHIQRNDVGLAAQRIEQAVAINPLDFGARLFEGAIRLIQGNFEQAIYSFRIAQDEKPTSATLYTNLAIAYIALKHPEKALKSLRKSVALNPLNLNSVMLLADLSFSLGKNEDAVPSLRFFLQFEQKIASVWERLARALLKLGQVDESIQALKRQGSLSRTSAIWNNLGVAYYRKGDLKKSLEAFKGAMELVGENIGRDFYLAARNAAVIIEQKRSPQELLRFTEMIIGSDSARYSLTDKEFSDLVELRILALFKTGDWEAAVLASENILISKEPNSQLTLWAATALLSWYSLNQKTEKALDLADKFSISLNEISKENGQMKERLINNIAFTYADIGRTDSAERYLSLISHRIHNEAYATATLGLVHLRKGHVEKGMALYEEAIHVAFNELDKIRIRQKLNVELGKHLIDSDVGRARRYLEKAISVKNGENGLVVQAKGLLKGLTLK